MTRVVLVLPSIVPETSRACLASLSPEIIDPRDVPEPPTRPRDVLIHNLTGAHWTDGRPDLRLVIVWNSPAHNLGCSQSWNVGVDEVLRMRADWLVVLSAAVRFHAPLGGTDLLKHLDACTGTELVLEADGGLGWHMICFSREVLETVGRFDPVFHPAYSEDLDWSVRFQRAYDRDSRAPGFVGPLWPKVPVDAVLTEVAHGIKRGSVEVDLSEMTRRFRAKWGPNEEYATPYNLPGLDWTYTGPPPT